MVEAAHHSLEVVLGHLTRVHESAEPLWIPPLRALRSGPVDQLAAEDLQRERHRRLDALAALVLRHPGLTSTSAIGPSTSDTQPAAIQLADHLSRSLGDVLKRPLSAVPASVASPFTRVMNGDRQPCTDWRRPFPHLSTDVHDPLSVSRGRGVLLTRNVWNISSPRSLGIGGLTGCRTSSGPSREEA